MIRDILERVYREPGLCSNGELHIARKFYQDLQDKIDLYKSVWNGDPLGQSCLSHIDQIDRMLALNESRAKNSN